MVYNIIMTTIPFENAYVEDVLSLDQAKELSETVEHYLKTLDITENEYDKNSSAPVKILRKMMGRIAVQNLPLPDSCLESFTNLITLLIKVKFLRPNKSIFKNLLIAFA